MKFIVSLKLLVLYLVAFLFSGCVVSVFEKEQHAVYYTADRVYHDDDTPMLLYAKGENNISLSSHCNAPYIYSMMISPIIPLPPVIPAFFLNKENEKSRFFISLRGRNITLENPLFTGLVHGKKVESKLVEVEEWSFYTKVRNLITLRFESSHCLELDGVTFMLSGVLYDNEPIDISPVTIKVKEGGLGMDFEYMIIGR